MIGAKPLGPGLKCLPMQCVRLGKISHAECEHCSVVHDRCRHRVRRTKAFPGSRERFAVERSRSLKVAKILAERPQTGLDGWKLGIAGNVGSRRDLERALEQFPLA